jgi:hypothetical protein
MIIPDVGVSKDRNLAKQIKEIELEYSMWKTQILSFVNVDNFEKLTALEFIGGGTLCIQIRNKLCLTMKDYVKTEEVDPSFRINSAATYLADCAGHELVIGGTAFIIPPGLEGKRLYNLFRKEFLREYASLKGPLSSDVRIVIQSYSHFQAFTRFGRHDSEIHNKEVREASVYVLQVVVPRFAALLNQNIFLPSHTGALIKEMHKWGINVRYLGLLYTHVTILDIKQLIRIGM